jgi:two-component system, cell cycle sensor histidine kinase and response regulator CckA
VLEADSGEAAMTIAQHYSGTIDLLLTDVIMPGMNGRELSIRFMQARPKTKIIFMSGYTDRIMTHDGFLDESLHFLQKPFTPHELQEVVRRAAGRDAGA